MNIALQPHRQPRAFTLLEMLIAIAIFAIVITAMSSVFYSALRLRNNATADLEAKLPVEQAVNVIRRDLAGLLPPGGILSSQLQTSATSGMNGQSGTAFYTSTGIIDSNTYWGDAQCVSYQLMTPVNAGPRPVGKDLVRVVSRNLLSTVQDQPSQQWLLSGVQNITFSYFDGSNWQDAWDSTTSSNLPTAIKVQIDLATENNQRAPSPIELVVPIVVQARTNQSLQTDGT